MKITSINPSWGESQGTKQGNSDTGIYQFNLTLSDGLARILPTITGHVSNIDATHDASEDMNP